MTQKSWRSRIAAYLGEVGYVRDNTPPVSKRYERYKLLTITGHTKYYHLGKAGACLVSEQPALTHAISITDAMHRRVERWEKQQQLDSMQAQQAPETPF